MTKKIRPGQIYKVVEPITFYVDNVFISRYDIGDQLIVIRRTTENPHMNLSSGFNYEVQTKNGVSIWTTLQRWVDQGNLELVNAA